MLCEIFFINKGSRKYDFKIILVFMMILIIVKLIIVVFEFEKLIYLNVY